MTLRIIPLDLAEANALVERWHRHHKPVVGHKFSLGLADDERVCGAAIVGLPVARMLMDGETLEVRRVATDGTKNACSKLLSACRRAATALGYKRLITYTLIEEGGRVCALRIGRWLGYALIGTGTCLLVLASRLKRGKKCFGRHRDRG